MAFAAATYAVQVLVVMPAFAKLEHQGAERDIDRCVDGLGRDLELLSRLACWTGRRGTKRISSWKTGMKNSGNRR